MVKKTINGGYVPPSNKKLPMLSVVITAHNTEAYTDSIKRQTVGDKSISSVLIPIINNSEDKCGIILEYKTYKIFSPQEREFFFFIGRILSDVLEKFQQK